MSERFRVAILCVILGVFAFVLFGMSWGCLRGMFRGYRIETNIILWWFFWFFLPGLVCLASILGLLGKKIWAKWTALSVCLFILVRAIHILLYRGGSVQKQIFGSFGGQNRIIWWLLSPTFWVPMLGIIGIVLALSITKKHFCKSR